ncbi:uncharacterized protein LOC132696792 [Cylas formicarius]|uniref:uncharacterized protein LOC132696792 n=1 Tax=Cylas formicarius TaxID=197179 RepID=UPI002958A81B|nr:uncharacterized protein LOC132696792 [Cylas formicarius]
MFRSTFALHLLNLFLASLWLSVCHGKGRSLPSNFPVCKRTDPNINQCLVDATEKVKPFLAEGVPSLKIPPFEPFQIPKIELAQGTRSLNFKAVLTNVLAYGLSNYKFTKFDYDIPGFQFFCEATIPGLNLEGDYTVTGRVLIAPIEGKGRFTAKIDSCEAFVYQKVKLLKRNGLDYLTPDFTNSTINVSGPRVKLDGLFGGNAQLNDVTNKAINDNVDELFAELKPVVEQTLTSILEDILFKSLFVNIPYDNLYPK